MRVSSAFIAFNILDCIRLARSLLYIIYLTSFNFDIIKSCVLFLYTATHQQIDTRSWKQTRNTQISLSQKNKPYFFFALQLLITWINMAKISLMHTGGPGDSWYVSQTRSLYVTCICTVLNRAYHGILPSWVRLSFVTVAIAVGAVVTLLDGKVSLWAGVAAGAGLPVSVSSPYGVVVLAPSLTRGGWRRDVLS